MRYNVGETIYTIFFDIEGRDRLDFFWPYMYNMDQVVKINIVPLIVTKHYKVRGDYDKEDTVPTYDGYVLKDMQGNTWYNQYPRASYGQISDECNQRFFRHMEKGDLETLRVKNEILESHLLTDVVGRVSRGIKSMEDTPDDVLYKILVDLKQQIEHQLKEEYQKVLVEEQVFPDVDIITHFIVKDA